MNINEIIEELKTFSDEDVIKFNKVFSDFYKPYKKKENEIKKKLKKQKEELQKAEAIKAFAKLAPKQLVLFTDKGASTKVLYGESH